MFPSIERFYIPKIEQVDYVNGGEFTDRPSFSGCLTLFIRKSSYFKTWL